MSFLVNEVVDGDTFTVAGTWIWNDRSGDCVRPLGYNTPEKGKPGYEVAKAKLKTLIEGKYVDIPTAVSVDVYGRLLARVFVNGVDLADYFPEYKV